MIPVGLGLLALVVGPLFAGALRRSPSLASGVDGFILCTVAGLVVLHIVPQSVVLAGTPGVVVAVLGFFVPALLHRLDAQRLPDGAALARRVAATGVVMGGAFVHALLDGAALIADDASHATMAHHDHGHGDEGLPLLALAVLLHRLPYSLAIWVVGRERLGTARAVLLLVALGAGTVVGAVVGDRLAFAGVALALVQAFAGGAVLHVLFDAPAFDVRSSPRASALGVIVGLATLAALLSGHPVVSVVEDELHFTRALVTLTLESAPAVVLGLAMLTVMERARLQRVVGQGRSTLTRAVSGVLAGAALPLCACTAVSAFEGLVRRRAAPAAVVAFLVAAAELQPAGALLSLELLGPTLTLARLGGAVVVALTAGAVVSALIVSPPKGPAEVEVPALGARAHVDHVLPWLTVGLVIAAFSEPLLAADAFVLAPPLFEVPLAALLGLPAYLCGSAATPLAALLLHKGASAGAVVAFVLSGPTINVATLALLVRLWSVRAAAAFAVAVIVGASVVGAAVNVAVAAGVVALPSLHADAVHAHSVVESAAALALAALLATSVWRQGARGFLGQIVHPLDEALGGHVHGPHCGHGEHRLPGFVKRAPVARIQL